MNSNLEYRNDSHRLAESVRLGAWLLVGLGLVLALTVSFFYVFGGAGMPERAAQPPTFTNAGDLDRPEQRLPGALEAPTIETEISPETSARADADQAI